MSYTIDKFTDLTITNRETNNFYHTDDFNLNITPESFELDLSAEYDALELIKVLGLDKANQPDMYDVTIQKPIQIRKHKKKRVNKKWAKQYGYVLMNIESKGWKITNKDDNLEFVKDISNSGESL